MADEVKIAYDKTDLRGITRAFKGMSDEAATEAPIASKDEEEEDDFITEVSKVAPLRLP